MKAQVTRLGYALLSEVDHGGGDGRSPRIVRIPRRDRLVQPVRRRVQIAADVSSAF
jgi:hypothetical protein